REVAALVNVSKHRGPEHPVCLLRRGFRDRVLMALDDQNRPVEFSQGLAEIVRLTQIDPQMQTYVGVQSSLLQFSREGESLGAIEKISGRNRPEAFEARLVRIDSALGRRCPITLSLEILRLQPRTDIVIGNRKEFRRHPSWTNQKQT